MPAPTPDEVYRGATRIFAAVILCLGIAILVSTIARGGGPLSLGVLLGVGFTGLGAGRLYLALRR